MNNQEAIETIKLALSQVEWDYPMDYATAFDMAISALQAQDAPDTNVGDMISRQAAIDECNKRGAEHIGYAIAHLPSAQPEPCEDAVSRQRLLNDLKELKIAWEKYPVMAEQIKGVETAIEYVEAIPSVTPKLSNIDFLMPESELVFYDNDHGFCINTQDVLEHIRGYMQ